MAATWRERLGERGIEVGQKIIWSLDKWYARKSKVGDRAFFDNRDFAWVPKIEADWKKVRAELDALMPYTSHIPNFQDISKD